MLIGTKENMEKAINAMDEAEKRQREKSDEAVTAF